jgi:hypothetical protein
MFKKNLLNTKKLIYDKTATIPIVSFDDKSLLVLPDQGQKYKKLNTDQQGFMHYALLFGLLIAIVGAIGYVGYRTFRTIDVSYKGTLKQQICHSIDKGCTTYSLTTPSKTYKLVLPTKPNIASGTEVTVTGTTKTSSMQASQPTISVSKITPLSAPNSSSATSQQKGNTTALNTGQPSTVTVTNANNGQTIDLKTGQSLVVNLSSQSWTTLSPGQEEKSQSQWNSFTSSNTAVLQTSGTTVYSKSPGPTSGSVENLSSQTYMSLDSGVSTVKAESSVSFVCGANTSCPQFMSIVPYSITVNISPSTQ